MTKFRAGVLIIGSLLWDNDQRDRWRGERLNMAAAVGVRAQIRYGRLSRAVGRAGQYTMTFSTSAAFGAAYVVPCRKPLVNPEDLFEEAQHLALAEGFSDADFWPDWGAVTLLLRERNAQMSDIMRAWPRYFEARVDADHRVQTTCGPGELPQIDDRGFLRVEWPLDLERGESAACDMLLATANEPSIAKGRYASPSEIADSLVNAAHQASYFCNNVFRGIRTFQDVEIWNELRQRQPDWLNDALYQSLAQSLVNNTT